MLKNVSGKFLLFAFIVGLLTACSRPAEQPAPPVSTSEKAATKQCELKPPAKPFACTMQYDPVCGCDGKTYGNACSARGAGVPDSTPGACDDKSLK